MSQIYKQWTWKSLVIKGNISRRFLVLLKKEYLGLNFEQVEIQKTFVIRRGGGGITGLPKLYCSVSANISILSGGGFYFILQPSDKGPFMIKDHSSYHGLSHAFFMELKHMYRLHGVKIFVKQQRNRLFQWFLQAQGF